MRRTAAAILAVSLALSTLVGCADHNDITETARVTRSDVTSRVSVSGNLEAHENRFVSFTVPGTVDVVLVEKGDTVSRGDVLARLDSRDLQRRVDLARTQVEQARVQYDIADQQLRETIYPNYYGSYVIDVPGIWMALDQATDRIQRAQDYIDQSNATEANVLLHQAIEDIERAEESAEARPWDLPIAIKVMELQREAAATRVRAAELEFETARDNLDDATITAPIHGVVTTINIKEGDVLSSADLAQPAFQIIDPSTLEMSGLIDEMDIADITLGQEVFVTLDALPGVEVEGTVTFISHAAMIQAGVVMYETIVSLHDPDPRVKDGMSATANIVTERAENVLTLPSAAIFRRDGRDIVYYIDRDGRPVAREVTIGLQGVRVVEIVSGLDEGDEVSRQAPQ